MCKCNKRCKTAKRRVEQLSQTLFYNFCWMWQNHIWSSSKLNFSASGFAVFFFWHGIDQNSILEFFFNCQMSSYANSTTLHCKSIQNSGCIDEQWPSHLEGILCVKTGRLFFFPIQNIFNKIPDLESNLSVFPRKKHDRP